MRTTLSLAALAALSSAAPMDKRSSGAVNFPLPDGFPNPSQDQLKSIEEMAKGTIPNGPLPTSISATGLVNLQVIAANELFETAYFTELLSNVTQRVPGFTLGYGHDYVVDALESIVAQEKLHALYANTALKAFGKDPIQPCKYNFPVVDFQSSIALAGTFTDVVLGTLQDVNQALAMNGDDALVRAISSVIGNEAEQEGFFRLVNGKRPSSQPFLTTSAGPFAFTAIKSFIIPGSCPNIDTIQVPTFDALTVATMDIEPKSQSLNFTIASSTVGNADLSKWGVVYINQLNTPVVKSLENITMEGDMVMFQADFPFDEYLMHGLTIAAVTKTMGPFTGVDDVATATAAGPALIEID